MLPDKTKHKSTTTAKFREELMALGKDIEDCTFLEVGHDMGYTTMTVNHAFTHVVALDNNPARHEDAKKLRENQGVKNVSLLLCTLEDLPEGPYEVVFIDADHRYESVKKDWEDLQKRNTAEKYTVVFHDYGLLASGVKRFIQETFRPEDITFMGEREGWNPLGGATNDWEAVRVIVENGR